VKKAKRENITPENIGEILLCQIPGISSHIATEVLKHFGGSFTQLITEIKTSPEKLDAIYLESSKGDGKRRKLSSAVIQSILRFLREDSGVSMDKVEEDHKSANSVLR
jgi:ERCC4-type nuclease